MPDKQDGIVQRGQPNFVSSSTETTWNRHPPYRRPVAVHVSLKSTYSLLVPSDQRPGPTPHFSAASSGPKPSIRADVGKRIAAHKSAGADETTIAVPTANSIAQTTRVFLYPHFLLHHIQSLSAYRHSEKVGRPTAPTLPAAVNKLSNRIALRDPTLQLYVAMA